jgi:hypothetical protein
MDLMSNLPIVKGDVFDWRDGEGWTSLLRLGHSFEPAFVGYTEEVGFVIESHRTGVKKIFVYDGSLHDEDGNFAGTKWVSYGGGHRVIIEWCS